jgi:hypothetical protein
LEEKILFNLGIKGKCRKTFSGTFFLPPLPFHLDAPQIGQTFFSKVFRNRTQLFGHTWIELYPSPNARISLFASSYVAGIEQFGNVDDNTFSSVVNATLEIL